MSARVPEGLAMQMEHLFRSNPSRHFSGEEIAHHLQLGPNEKEAYTQAIQILRNKGIIKFWVGLAK